MCVYDHEEHLSVEYGDSSQMNLMELQYIMFDMVHTVKSHYAL